MHHHRSRHRSSVLLAILSAIFVGSQLVIASRHKHTHRVPIIDLNGAEELIGSITEDASVVTISPQLRILRGTGPICRYELSSPDDSKSMPFESEILDKVDGTAQIRLRNGASIDCSDKEFHLQVTAVRCADELSRSETISLKITVQDVNNHAPEFEAPWYSFEVDEGKSGVEVARLYATDKDCGHPYGKICRYEITNVLEENPFHIDDQGVLTTIRPLNRSRTDSHILTVVAQDCGMQRSKSTLVTVHVKPRCIDGIHESSSTAMTANKQIDYFPGAGGKRLMPNARIVVCPRENTCTVKSVEAKMLLELKHQHEELDSKALKQCELKPETLNLLPHVIMDEKVHKIADVDDEEGEKYFFDGKSTAVTVPSNTLKVAPIPEKFTLSFAMKHNADTKQEQSVKQNLLCESDDFGMNRHHFAVYIRHCKLELLLRREAENAAAEFRAAEWRWDTPEVCDGKWHSYAILFSDLDNVTLMVDGARLDTTDRNPEILDDWPLHQTKLHKTRLVVGACWHGRNQAMTQFFNGRLSSMYLLTGQAEPESVFQCLHKSPERLRFSSIDQLVSGESVSFDKDQTHLTLKANTLEDLSLLLQKVEYIIDVGNAPIPTGKRTIITESRALCVEANRSLPLGVHQSTVMVNHPTTPRLFVSGQNLISTDRRSLKVGSVMLPDIQITVTQSIDGMEKDVSTKHNLDWCKVHLKPSRDMDLEYFSSPAALISSLNIDFEHDKQGIMLKGVEGVKGFTDVLSKIHYFNTRSESYDKRQYTVQCAMMGGRVLSNEFFVTMTIKNDDEQQQLEEAIGKLTGLARKVDGEDEPMKMEKHYEPSYDQLGSNRLQNILEMDLPRPKALLGHHGYEVGQGAVAGGAVAVVVVICVGFLLILLVVGVLKMRDNPLPRRRKQHRKPTLEGMEWDDTDGMNIITNPLDDVEKNGGSGGVGISNGPPFPRHNPQQICSEGEDDEEEDEEEESSDDGESAHEDDEMSEEDGEGECQVLPLAENSRQGLEWDDSLALSNSVSKKTYHV